MRKLRGKHVEELAANNQKQSNGYIEEAGKTTREMMRTLMETIKKKNWRRHRRDRQYHDVANHVGGNDREPSEEEGRRQHAVREDREQGWQNGVCALRGKSMIHATI